MGCAWTMLFGISLSSAHEWWTPAERAKASQELSRLRLYDLQTQVLERALQEANSERKPAIASQLALALSKSMETPSDLAPELAAKQTEMRQSQLEKLLAEYPDAATPTLQVTILEQEYQRVERQIGNWLNEPVVSTGREEARKAIHLLLPRFTSLRATLLKEQERLATKLEGKTASREVEALEAEATKVEIQLTKLGYLQGWAEYYGGLTLVDAGEQKKLWTEAQKTLQELLTISESRSYPTVDSSNMNLETPWRARTVIALGLTESGLGNAVDSDLVFSWLGNPAVSAELFDQARYWRLQGLLYAGRWKQGLAFVRAQPEYLTGTASQGKANFAIALIRGGARATSTGEAAIGTDLQKLGIAGLVRLKQYFTLQDLSKKLQLSSTPAGQGLWLLGMEGKERFSQAEKSHKKEDFQAALSLLQKALASEDAKEEAVFAAELRYQSGWCHFRLEEWDAANKQFRSAVNPLRRTKPELAQQASWMAFAALQKLADKDPKQATAALRALDTFQQEFPKSTLATKANLYRARLAKNDKVALQTIEKLAKIPAGDAGYQEAQAELAVLYKQQYDAKVTEKQEAEAAAIAQKILQAVDRYLDLPVSSSAEITDQSLSLSLVALGLLREPTPDNQTRFQKYVQKGERVAVTLDKEDPLKHEWLYRAFQQSLAAKDNKQAEIYAEQLAEADADSPYAAPALVIQAKKLDDELSASTSPAQRLLVLPKVVAVYRKLRVTAPKDPAELKANKNAATILSRLAQYEQELGNLAVADEILQQLLKAFPTDKKTLQRLMSLNQELGRPEPTLEFSRPLLSALAVGSDDWLGAKYCQLWALSRTDSEKAKQVFKQLKVLLPVDKWNNWRERLEGLEQKLSS